MEYLGYRAAVEFDGEIFCGTIENISDLVTFESETTEGLEKEFRSAVEVYIAFRNSMNRNSSEFAATV